MIPQAIKLKINIFLGFFLLSQNLCLASFSFTPTDGAFEYPYDLPAGTYHSFCKNVYSQNGEDGILEQLIKELEIENGTFCEFGASDGIDSSNTYNLILNYHFTGMAIEADKLRYLKCKRNYRSFSNIQVFNGMVLYGDPALNLNAWLKKGNLPVDLDVLSIDIDHDDYYVWDDLTDYQPKIVIIEINSYRDPIYDELPGIPSKEYNIDPLKTWCPGRVACGSSFMSMIKLGLEKGYIPVAFTGNITFVRKDLIQKLHYFPYKISNDPYDYASLYTHLVLWRSTWYTNTGLILNVAIRDYYEISKTKFIDEEWLSRRVDQILNNR